MIKTRNQIKIETSSSSMSDLVFLLLIFFMITSTLIAPNAVKLMLPESSSRTMAKQNVTVYIDPEHNFYVGETAVPVSELQQHIAAGIESGIEDACSAPTRRCTCRTSSTSSTPSTTSTTPPAPSTRSSWPRPPNSKTP